LTLQVFRERVSASALALTLGTLLVLILILVLVFKHLVADRWLALRLVLKIPGHFGQLAFLVRGKLLGFFAEELAFEFGDLQERLLQLSLQTLFEGQLGLQPRLLLPQGLRLRL
jgi:hypothetical protein